MVLFLTLVGGLIALVLGGDMLVRGASSIARRLGVSPLLIGLTLVGFGTSAPELVTSLQAAFAGSPGIAVGNVVGSNIANILLILGAAALLSPIVVRRAAFVRDGMVLGLSALFCVGVVLLGRLEPWVGGVFLACLLSYLVFSIRQERRAPDVAAAAPMDVAAPRRGIGVDILLVVAGLGLTILGARWLVSASITLAASLGVSETVIGLTVVAIGTSLPELVTSVAAGLRREGDLAFGNIVGSNIYNVLFILGATAIIQPVAVPPGIADFDIWVMLGATALLAAMAVSGWRVSRLEGGLLLCGYGAYMSFVVIGAVADRGPTGLAMIP